MAKKTESSILKKLKKKEITCDKALEDLSSIGWAPSLLNDDNGHWAVSVDGMQSVSVSTSKNNSPFDVAMSCFVEKAAWKKSIWEAIVWAIEKQEE